MRSLQFVNKARGVLEQGDMVVIASRQSDVKGRIGVPVIDVELAQAIHILTDLRTDTG